MEVLPPTPEAPSERPESAVKLLGRKNKWTDCFPMFGDDSFNGVWALRECATCMQDVRVCATSLTTAFGVNQCCRLCKGTTENRTNARSTIGCGSGLCVYVQEALSAEATAIGGCQAAQGGPPSCTEGGVRTSTQARPKEGLPTYAEH